MPDTTRKLKNRFEIRRKLGQGTYGKVQLGINKETGQEVAIKTIKKSKIETEADLVRIRREIQIMSSVQHPNIIHIYEGTSYQSLQEAMESFAFPDRINPLSTEIPQTYSKLYFFPLESFEKPLYVWDVFSKGKAWINKSKTCFCSNLEG